VCWFLPSVFVNDIIERQNLKLKVSAQGKSPQKTTQARVIFWLFATKSRKFCRFGLIELGLFAIVW